MNKEKVLVSIYELRDPRDPLGSPRYVGRTQKSLINRLKSHIYNSKINKKPSHKDYWILSLLKENIIPTIHLIEEVEGWDYSSIIEMYWIKEFKLQGYVLINSTNGGDGTLGFKMPDWWIEKIKKIHAGKTVSEETKLKLKNYNLNKKATEETKEKMSKSRKGKTFTKKHIENLKIARLKYLNNIENKEKLVQSIRKTHCIKIKIVYPDGQEIKYNSLTECSNLTGFHRKSLAKWLKSGFSQKHKIKVLKYER